MRPLILLVSPEFASLELLLSIDLLILYRPEVFDSRSGSNSSSVSSTQKIASSCLKSSLVTATDLLVLKSLPWLFSCAVEEVMFQLLFAESKLGYI